MPKPTADERAQPLVKEKKKIDLIHSRFKYAEQAWRKIRQEAKEDMRHVSGDPWDPKEKLARQKVNRPTPANDEISQYLNQVINGVKENKRALGFNPVGFGADDKTAEFYGNKWREIWYRSHAQQHTTRAFQNMVERSYGYVKLRTEYVTDIPGGPNKPWSAFNQRLVIDGCPDPDCVYPDPDFLDATGRDWKWLIEIEGALSLDAFRKAWPKAEIQSFSPDLVKYAQGWIGQDGRTRTVRIASYWEIATTRRILNAWRLTNPATGQQVIYELFDDDEDMAEKARKFGTVIDKREVEEPKVWHYRTNGVEILEKHEWRGKRIPYVGFFGKMMWVDLGTGPELVIQSMVRLARGPNMMLAYYLACEAEIIGMTPKVPYFVWKGSLDTTNAKRLQIANRVPVPFVEVETTMNQLGGGAQATPGLPERQLFEPPIQAIEIAKESSRRAIQAAMGLTPLPTSAQKRNEKSGVALKQIEESGQRGSYHFIDSYDMGLISLGELGEDLIPKIYDTAGETPVLDAQKRPVNAFVNARLLTGENGALPPGVPEDALPSIDGLHAVTLDVEPDFASQRDKAEKFTSDFIASPFFQALLAGAPDKAMEIMALAIKLLDLGPIGTEIADVLHPKEKEQGMVPAAQLEEVKQVGQQVITALQQKIAELMQEKEAKIVETEGRRQISAEANASKERIAELNAEVKLEDRDRQSETMILLEEMKQNLEMLMTRENSVNEQRRLRGDIDKTALQLRAQAGMKREDRASTEREGERNRQATAQEGRETRALAAHEGRESRAAEAREGAANRQATAAENAAARASADRNAAEDRKIKAQQAKQKPRPNGRA